METGCASRSKAALKPELGELSTELGELSTVLGGAGCAGCWREPSFTRN